MSLIAVLRDEGCEAMGAGNGTAALSAVHAFDPHVVIVDIALPDMTGWDVAREVRKQSQRKRTLIAVTGTSVAKPDEVMSRIAGFDHFLLKPCDPSFLLNILGAIIPKH